MVITVDKVEVLSDVRRQAEYIGSKIGKWDLLRVVSGDEELLYRWITIACSDIESVLHEISKPGVSAGMTWSIEIKHKNHREGVASSIANSYVEDRVLSEWLKIVDPDKSDYYKMQSMNKMEELRKIAYYKDF